MNIKENANGEGSENGKIIKGSKSGMYYSLPPTKVKIPMPTVSPPMPQDKTTEEIIEQ